MMTFSDISYKTYKTTSSQQMYHKGDTVYADGRDGAVNLHQNTVDNPVKLLDHNTQLIITGESVESASSTNYFNYYLVSGNGFKGYIASAYLNTDKEKRKAFLIFGCDFKRSGSSVSYSLSS